MKILYLVHSSFASDGSSIALQSIIHQMLKLDNQVYVICPKSGPLVDILKEQGATVYIVDYVRNLYPKVITFKSFFSWPIRFLNIFWRNFRAENKIERIVKRISPDVIHTNIGVVRIGAKIAKKMGVPHVWHIRETDEGLFFHHIPCRKYQIKMLKTNDLNIAITESVKQHYNLDSSNTKVIYDGVFSNEYKTPDSSKSNYFLFVGRLYQSKGADWAVESFLKIACKLPDVELWMAGEDQNKFAKSLKAKVVTSPYRHRIKFLGQRNDIYELMSHAQAVLVPSVNEGFGFITVEAMVNGTLVIGRNTGGTKEQFDNGLQMVGREIALRFETLEEMSSQMEAVCRNGQDYYKEMIRDAEMVVRNLYTVEYNAQQIIGVYISLISK